MADTYSNCAELAAMEVLGQDYAIRVIKQSRDMIIVAPHAGGIEVGATELSLEIAGKDYSVYLFEGRKSSGNMALHVTSTNFDEPIAMKEIAEHKRSVSVHGYSDSTVKHTIVGGLDIPLRDKIVESLIAAGFSASVATDRFTAKNPRNIVNRCATGAGVQLELSTLQRKAFFTNDDWSSSNRGNVTEDFSRYAGSIRSAIVS
ncbi:poly-gamma-glutamate hydrolase family protein [Bacillus velezensis]|uniref:poly-gamma-glutamate hydrolase family protein n=1 Tax=Bacillus velezensis TaxID=492670 RepID=UPI0018C5F0A5|nr:poly-gamma-glutamate hydrolase family protein [Bacillus velezensis]QPK89753.1 poly-gamma-glutamate hydrolase family protein [Bacillus velezensis]